jgi:hypothetical protein
VGWGVVMTSEGMPRRLADTRAEELRQGSDGRVGCSDNYGELAPLPCMTKTIQHPVGVVVAEVDAPAVAANDKGALAVRVEVDCLQRGW